MDILNPKQTVLFPDLIADIDLPSITTLPDYEKAIQNFIKLSDFGAFVELNVSGIEKSFSFSFNELRVPRRYRQNRRGDISSPVFHLFPAIVRNHFNRLKYDARSFFNRSNSIKTRFGHFLLRQYFHVWDRHRKAFNENLINYLQNEIGEKRYRDYFAAAWDEAADFIKTGIKRKFQHLVPAADMAAIRTERKRLDSVNMTISNLDYEDPDYFLSCLTLKTLHIPIDLEDYIKGISIFSSFTTIYLEHLKNINIETHDDLLAFLHSLKQES